MLQPWRAPSNWLTAWLGPAMQKEHERLEEELARMTFGE
jgi:hypothetical protein